MNNQGGSDIRKQVQTRATEHKRVTADLFHALRQAWRHKCWQQLEKRRPREYSGIAAGWEIEQHRQYIADLSPQDRRQARMPFCGASPTRQRTGKRGTLEDRRCQHCEQSAEEDEKHRYWTCEKWHNIREQNGIPENLVDLLPVLTFHTGIWANCIPTNLEIYRPKVWRRFCEIAFANQRAQQAKLLGKGRHKQKDNKQMAKRRKHLQSRGRGLGTDRGSTAAEEQSAL